MTTETMREAVARGIAVDAWQSMLDAAAKEAIASPLPESADSGRG